MQKCEKPEQAQSVSDIKPILKELKQEKWGWIPNISGETSSLDSIKEIKDNINRTNDKKEGPFQFLYADSGKIIASSDWTVEIEFHGESGLCKLDIEHSYAEYDLEYDIRERVWSEFRRMLDSNSGTKADCSAMDRLVIANKDNVKSMITKKFIDTMESISDRGIDLIEKFENPNFFGWEELYTWALDLECITESNHIYFMRFLDMHDEKRSHIEKNDDTAAAKKIMNARYRKATAINRFNIQGAEFRYRQNSLDAAKVSAQAAEESAQAAKNSTQISIKSLNTSRIAIIVGAVFAVAGSVIGALIGAGIIF
jgi:hypothetical protein